ncbi:MAG: UDP-N-acetylmuramate dehydrogenase [Mucilaginibacter polytrichastri]|nr:UDP-N-acetylmuramate dehydrogenase [Mucilaginibacter polytrichastri]
MQKKAASAMKALEDFDLTSFNSYRIVARCKRAFFPDSEDDIRQLYQNPEYAGKKIILGSGHNVIFAEDYYQDDFIIFSGNFDRIDVDSTQITVEAGATLLQLSELALDLGLAGLETFYDIPSSVGGAVVMNAGAGGEEIKDLLVKVRYYDPAKDQFGEIHKEDMGFEYRNSYFQRNPGLIITQAVLRLEYGNKADIKEKMDSIKTARWSKQPKDFPNAGSVFKRPPGRFVGPMIDELSLKGFTVGGAQVSEKHGGFIVNTGYASGKDILGVINHVKAQVMERFNVDLEIEQRII